MKAWLVVGTAMLVTDTMPNENGTRTGESICES